MGPEPKPNSWPTDFPSQLTCNDPPPVVDERRAPDEEPPVLTRDVIEALISTSPPALANARARAERLAEDRVLAVDVHVPTIVLAVAISAPRIEEVIAAASSRIPTTFDPADVANLRTYAAAAWHAHVRATVVSNARMQTLLDEAVACREALLVWARGLAETGWLARAPHADTGRRSDARALAHDIVALVELLTEAWPQIGVFGIQGWHLARATGLALDLLVAREAGTRVDEGARRMRARAFSVLAWAYDACRELLRELRRDDGDLEDIAPCIGVPERPEDEEPQLDGPSPCDLRPDASRSALDRRCLPN